MLTHFESWGLFLYMFYNFWLWANFSEVCLLLAIHVDWVVEASFQSCFVVFFFFCQMPHRYLWLNFYVNFSALGFLYHLGSVNLDSELLHGKSWDFDSLCKTFFVSNQNSGQGSGGQASLMITDAMGRIILVPHFTETEALWGFWTYVGISVQLPSSNGPKSTVPL